MTHDLVIAGGRIATGWDVFEADIGVRDGQIATLGHGLTGAERLEAAGKIVVPGGIESHCHIAQESSTGMMTADDYRSGSISAAFGGNTTIIPFAAQHPGQSIAEVIATYDERAAVSVLDWGYHLIVSDPAAPGFDAEIRAAFDRGVTSFKVFMTYDMIKVTDAQFLEVLLTAREAGALTMVHAENNDMVNWMRARMGERGYLEPRYHAPSRPVAAEDEAIYRAIRLARMVDAPLLIVHVSSPEGLAHIAQARAEGAAIYGETCPQYLFLTAGDLDREDGAKFICSPPLRDATTQEVLWRGLRNGVLDLYSSDHAPYRMDETGKLAAGGEDFRRIANGMPGIGMRLPLLFDRMMAGAVSLTEFVAWSAGNQARLFGLAGRKGTIAPGADADIAIWDPAAEWVVTADSQHDNMDYTPFEGRRLRGRVDTVIRRGEVVVADGTLRAEPGSGRFLARDRFDRRGRGGRVIPELEPARNFGADLL